MKIKRLSLIITLALCLTVGGVYATWTYAEGQIQPSSGTASLTIEAAANEGEAGTINVDTNSLSITVENGGSYNTILSVTGNITVTLTPTPETDPSLLPSLLPTSFSWTITLTEAAEEATYGGQKILTVTGTTKYGTFENNTATITAADIEELITLTEFTLKNTEEHESYKNVIEAIDGPAFTITVTPVYD
ncbi:MAG: hypothetical protein J6K44_04560 [Clostridia bacterium]|nr:hypothetical protein [Clostridia bacterium]MBP3583298.1 hypothetical protein [Clostridia bacterium]